MVTVSERDASVVVAIDGELDMATASALRKPILDAIAGGHRHIVLDLTQVTFIDSTGLSVIIGAHKRLQPDGAIAVATESAMVRRVFHLTGLTDLLPMTTTVTEALVRVHAIPTMREPT